MRDKNNEPIAGCSMLLGCGSILMITMIISMIIALTALSGYMPEISARRFTDQEELSAYVISLIEDINSEIETLNLNYLQILINAAQIVILFLIFKLIYKRPLSQMGLSSQSWFKRLCLGITAGVIAISLYALIASLLGIAVFEPVDLRSLNWADMLTGLVFFISVGFYEEILSRGYFMTVLKTTRNKRLIIAIPAVIFGFMHLLNPSIGLLGILNIFLIGLAFAYMFIKTGSLWMPIGYHISWNFFQGYIYGIQVSGLEQMSLMKYTATGSDLLTGGAFGAEGGLVCTAIILGLLAYIHFILKIKETPVWTLDSDLPFTP